MSITKTTEIIKKKAVDLGFSSCGISKARFLKEEEKKFEDWLNNGYQGSMNYLNNCLLYTSPSPRDLSTSRMPSSA